MDLKDLVPIVSLISTLAMAAYIIGQLRSVFATREQLSTLERDIRSELTKKERESVSHHSALATKAELREVEDDLRGDLKEFRGEVKVAFKEITLQYQGILEGVTGLSSRLTGYIDKQKRTDG